MSNDTEGYALVGCSECDGYGTWIADRNRTRTRCPYCGKRYDVERRHFFATITSDNDLPVLRDTRGRINAKRSGELSAWHREREGTPFGERISLPTDWHSEKDGEIPAYAELYRDRANDYLNQRMGPAKETARPPLFRDVFKEEAERVLAKRGPATNKSECTNATEFLDERSNVFPWTDDPTGLGKTRLVVAAATLGDSPTDPVLWGTVFDAEFGDDEGKHRARSDWLADHYPNLWEKSKTASGFVTVNPTAEALYLIRACNRSKQLPWVEPDGAKDADGDPLPIQRFCQTIGSNRGTRNGLTDRQLGLALGLLADHRSTLVNEEGAAKELDSGAVPKAQRFALPSRAKSLGKSFDQAADALEQRFDWAVALTLTLPRTTADSAIHSYRVMGNGWERFRDRLRYSRADRPRPGYVPPYVWVQEPHRDGWAHRHVIFGGERRLMDAGDVREDWAECLNIPACTDATPWLRLATLRLSDGWHVVESDEPGTPALSPASSHPPAVADGGASIPKQYQDAGGLRPYYRKGMTRLVEMAASSVSELYEQADRLENSNCEATDRDREMARLAFMWPTAPPLTDSSDLGTQQEGERYP